MLQAVESSMHNSMKPTNILKSFRRAGLWPIDPEQAFHPATDSSPAWAIVEVKTTALSKNNVGPCAMFEKGMKTFARFQQEHVVRCVFMYVTQRVIPRTFIAPKEVGQINNSDMKHFALPGVLHRFHVAASQKTKLTQQ